MRCVLIKEISQKAVQLGHMGDMYAQSVRTVAWLGEGTVFDLELARCYMLHVDVLPAVVAYVQENVAVSLSEGWDENNFYERLGLSTHACDWEAYINFSNERTYFDRTWIIQKLHSRRRLWLW
mgnify:CR=1 FL=1|tara:strand:- start:32814 stop:33182 length:369 start_codon:yes stop_codon:yes gene_type:complete